MRYPTLLPTQPIPVYTWYDPIHQLLRLKDSGAETRETVTALYESIEATIADGEKRIKTIRTFFTRHALIFLYDHNLKEPHVEKPFWAISAQCCWTASTARPHPPYIQIRHLYPTLRALFVDAAGVPALPILPKSIKPNLQKATTDFARVKEILYRFTDDFSSTQLLLRFKSKMGPDYNFHVSKPSKAADEVEPELIFAFAREYRMNPQDLNAVLRKACAEVVVERLEVATRNGAFDRKEE